MALKMKVKNVARNIEKISVVIILLIATGAIIPLVQQETGVVIEQVRGDNLVQIIWTLIYLITFILIFPKVKAVLYVFKKNKLLCLLIGVALLSILWSGYPEVTLRRIIALLGTTLLGIYIAIRFNFKEINMLLFWTFILGALLSVILIVISSSWGVHNDMYHAGSWRGIYNHKNIFGRLMALATIWTIILIVGKKLKYTSIGLLFAGVFLALLLLSNSVTSLIIFFTLLILLSVYKVINLQMTSLIPLTILIILCGSLAVAWANHNLDSILFFFGRDETLTGRTQLWQVMWGMIGEKLWLGYGFGAFWIGGEGPSGHLWEKVGWDALNGHNGLFDLWLQIGLVGVIIFILSLVSNIVKAIDLVRKNTSFINMTPLVFFSFFLLINISESSILEQKSFFWILYVIFSIMLNTGEGGLCQEDHSS